MGLALPELRTTFTLANNSVVEIKPASPDDEQGLIAAYEKGRERKHQQVPRDTAWDGRRFETEVGKWIRKGGLYTVQLPEQQECGQPVPAAFILETETDMAWEGLIQQQPEEIRIRLIGSRAIYVNKAVSTIYGIGLIAGAMDRIAEHASTHGLDCLRVDYPTKKYEEDQLGRYYTERLGFTVLGNRVIPRGGEQADGTGIQMTFAERDVKGIAESL